MPSIRKWVQGANGLWTSYDPLIQRRIRRLRGLARMAEIRARLDVVMARNGWTKAKNHRWYRLKPDTEPNSPVCKVPAGRSLPPLE